MPRCITPRRYLVRLQFRATGGPASSGYIPFSPNACRRLGRPYLGLVEQTAGRRVLGRGTGTMGGAGTGKSIRRSPRVGAATDRSDGPSQDPPSALPLGGWAFSKKYDSEDENLQKAVCFFLASSVCRGCRALQPRQAPLSEKKAFRESPAGACGTGGLIWSSREPGSRALARLAQSHGAKVDLNPCRLVTLGPYRQPPTAPRSGA